MTHRAEGCEPSLGTTHKHTSQTLRRCASRTGGMLGHTARSLARASVSHSVRSFPLVIHTKHKNIFCVFPSTTNKGDGDENSGIYRSEDDNVLVQGNIIQSFATKMRTRASLWKLAREARVCIFTGVPHPATPQNSCSAQKEIIDMHEFRFVRANYDVH